jgi:multidrug efflux pump subunit AcrA (membrane-fusion protein)
MRYTGLILISLLSAECGGPGATEPEVVVQVRVAAVEARDLEVTVVAPATIFPRREAKLAARLTTPIETLEARKGDSVRQGQVLARLVRNDLESQRAEMTAQVADAAANLEKVSSGTLPGDVQRANGEAETAAAALAEAEQIYKRRQTLLAEGAIPERELLISKTQYDQAQAANRTAQRSLKLLLESSREQDLRMAQSRLEQAKARLAFIETQLGYAEIRSPFDGSITEQFLYPGDMTKPDSPIFTVMDLSAAIARGQVPQGQAAGIREGQPCWFESIDSPEQRSRGKVSVVNQAIDPARRTVEVWCEIPNSGGALKAGAFGRLVAITATHARALTVPLPAVQFEEGKSEGIAWAVGSDNVAHERPVKTGVVSDGRVEILDGLLAGENVVIEGGYGLADGANVAVAPTPAVGTPQ